MSQTVLHKPELVLRFIEASLRGGSQMNVGHACDLVETLCAEFLARGWTEPVKPALPEAKP